MKEVLESQILISSKFDETVDYLKQKALESEIELILVLREKNLKVEDVIFALEKAYLASERREVIVLGADSFSEVVQNRLLKVIEEPPKNKSFILLFKSKASVLPTIASRLPIHIIKDKEPKEVLDLDINSLTLDGIYSFLQDNRRLDSLKAKTTIEKILKEALASQKYNIDRELLDIFSNSILALDKGSPASFVLSSVLLNLFSKRKN